MEINGIIAKFHLEDWFKKSFTSKEKDYIALVFPSFINGGYNKDYSSALALATNIVPALDLPDDKYFEYRKINAKVQEKIIQQVLKLIEDAIPIVEKYIIFNIIIYYIMRHKGVFIDNEQVVELSKQQLAIFEQIQDNILTFQEKYKDFDLEKNYGYETLYKIYDQSGDKDKILELFQKFQSKNNKTLENTIITDEGLINAYCKKVYKEIFGENSDLFIQTSLDTLKFPSNMKSWIELVFVTAQIDSNFLNIENPMENLAAYKCYIGIILNSTEPIQDYLKQAKSLFPNNEVQISSKTPYEILINLTKKDVVEKKSIFNNPNIKAPWCHYHAEIAQYLNQCGFKIDLNTVIVNYMLNMFEFLKINTEFQKSFNILLQLIDKKYFICKEIQSSSFVPSIFTENDVLNFLSENATSIINESWHSFTDFFSVNDPLDFLVREESKYDFEDFLVPDFISKKTVLSNESKIKNIFSDSFEPQQEYFSVISLKESAPINDYLKSANEIFQNHKIEYDNKFYKIYISFEKDDFIIKNDCDVIKQIIDDTHEDFLKITKQNKNAKYPDEYIDLASYAKYIFANSSYLLIEYKIEYFKKLEQLLKTIDKNDFDTSENSTISITEKTFEIDSTTFNKINFNTDPSFLNYSNSLRNGFTNDFESIVLKYWNYFRPNYFIKDYEHMLSYLALPSDYSGIEESDIRLLYDFNDIAEETYSDEDTRFIPKIDNFDKRNCLIKQKEFLKLGINLNYVKLETITKNLNSIFQNRNIKTNIKKRMAIIEIPVYFSDIDIISEKEKLEISFNKHLGFVKLAYAINLQCKSENHLEYINDKDLILTIAYNESRYLMKLKQSFYDDIEKFFYAIGRQNFIEKYDSEDIFSLERRF